MTNDLIIPDFLRRELPEGVTLMQAVEASNKKSARRRTKFWVPTEKDRARYRRDAAKKKKAAAARRSDDEGVLARIKQVQS